MRILLAAAAAFGIIGSAVAAAEPLTRDQAEQAIRSRLTPYLKDPGAAQLQIDRGPMFGQVATKSGSFKGWLVCAQLNAKNSYGGYVGFERYLFVIPEAGGEVAVLKQVTRAFENVDAYRAACYLDPPQVDGQPSPAA